ncbi:UDP-4-amino-4,6-dideoxy-N-acetyl-beta-L-altrosamine N-acetyltransferase [Campylobacter sp. TTU_617]|uniref:UDP-4-amino-4, 6-dideoxy-N-acetyl-beta-L-altrosamine N-acetyltransferase n=1 Tax=Campylobacter sp. TTU_617 TaxID=2768148 RepID=UPI001903A4D9|nr:UDP-4-amino-4,6-dideoxy-N-acetyl-beta-L-altrosamine N-acetyltransferase [Campylobacter sp. TTU_617]MBK1972418.1 UDP-4-amino-4,6-dideoxy-N-acetyl-beta-L-altrosamine N-acetyltransferase [Campylobacter sp. TTU_617]
MIFLKDFATLNEEEKRRVLMWRNDDEVSSFAKVKNINLKEHLNFIEELKYQKDKQYFLVYKEKEAIGVISFVNITPHSCEFGLYAKPRLRGMGKILIQEIKNYAFNTLKVGILKACVFKNNEKALKLYKKNHFSIVMEDESMFYISLSNHSYKKTIFS